MKRLPLILASALLLAPAAANDQVRDVQGALKGQGFYYGEVTGTESAETGAAIRRFQIRIGIPVTGKLNAATLAALGIEGKPAAGVAHQPAPKPAPANPVQQQVNPPASSPKIAPARGEPMVPAKGGGGLLPGSAPKAVEKAPVRLVRQNDPSVIEPPAPLPAAVSTPFSTMFRATPYATASREVQMDVVRRAQAFMAARRCYRGPIDGVAGPATSEAIFIFQEQAELRRTGRLDPDTLAEMNLLPQAANANPLLKPFYNPNRRRDRSVLSE